MNLAHVAARTKGLDIIQYVEVGLGPGPRYCTIARGLGPTGNLGLDIVPLQGPRAYRKPGPRYCTIAKGVGPTGTMG